LSAADARPAADFFSRPAHGSGARAEGAGRMTPARKNPRVKKGRHTIGILLARLGDIGYAANVWPGVAAVAEERDANLICFIGGALEAPQEFSVMRNVVYDLAGPRNVDGLVGLSGSIGQFIGPERMGRFCERFRPLPLVSVGMELEGIPGVLVDNSAGVREAVAHLIEAHGLRRIAFIRGPRTSPEAETRYRAYLDALKRHGLEFDPDLVAEGDFSSSAGRDAVALFMDRRRTDFQAIVSANDAMALDAIGTLRERGVRVPDQVRVVGFDDLEEARYAVPPMTTVRQPSREQGRRAAELLLDLLEGKPVPRKVVLPTELVVRRSCGCASPMVDLSAAAKAGPPGAKSRRPSAAGRNKILAEMESTAGDSAAVLNPDWAGRLFDALTQTRPRGGRRDDFLHVWEDLLRQVGIQGGDVMQWHAVLSALHRGALPFLGRGYRSAGDRTWRTAELLIGEIAQWAQASRRFQAGWQSLGFMTRISEPLMTVFDVEGLADAVAERLPELGSRTCFFCLYDFPEDGTRKAPTEWSRLVLAVTEKGRAALEPGGRRFPTRELMPKDLLAPEERFAVVLEPLHFRDENQFGFILFGPLQNEISLLREALGRQIGTALQGAALLQERRRAEETLREGEQAERLFQQRLRILLDIGNELSREESVDGLCRRAVELGLTELGFDRMGIWFHNPELAVIEGSFGTDSNGKVIDERGICVKAEYSPTDILRQTHPVSLIHTDVDLRDAEGNSIGRGMRAEAPMWDGVRTIGLIAVDNLLRRRPITEHDSEILNSYACTLGYLCSRKRAEESLRSSERAQREFDERLRTILEISNELSRVDSVDDLCRRAVELGHARLGFDRLGIWFFNPDPGLLNGSFGIDAEGNLVDERDIHLPTTNNPEDILHQTRPVAMLQRDVDLRDGLGRVVGRGDTVQVAMWDGEKTIGLVGMDNLLRRFPITERDSELLNLYASTLGYLCSRKRVEEALRAGERKERSFQERLRILLEISNELSRAESVDDLCRRAVELGRSRLDFDRLGIWFYSPGPGTVRGSYGTDADGNIADEREILLSTEGMQMEILKQTRPIALLWQDVVLRDGISHEVGRGTQAQAAMWNGEKVIGFVSLDNLLRGRPITPHDCEILNLFASTIGYLSSRKRAEEALKEYSDDLEEKVEERTRALRQAQQNLVRQEKLAVLGQLAATVSHEIRNPLATIRVSTTAVEQKVRGKGLDVERPLDRIQRNITRCDAIITELLEYTRMPELNLQTVEIDAWLDRLLDELAKPGDLPLRRDLHSGIRMPLDAERFRRVIINLLENARHAMQSMPEEDRAGKELVVETRSSGDALTLTVRDSGIGIPPEVLPHVFEPLFSTKGFGVGLGLAIVRGIVEQHGGTIELASEVGRGTSAVVRLPLARKEGGRP
jgi:sigma-B regulation protein RsbU (phosphoserine phosphatase)